MIRIIEVSAVVIVLLACIGKLPAAVQRVREAQVELIQASKSSRWGLLQP